MSRSFALFVLALVPALACSNDAERRASSDRPSLAVVRTGAPVTSTTTPDASGYEPVSMPFPSRAWLNRAEGALLVESCVEVEAFMAQGRALTEVVDHSSYACGPEVTSRVTASGTNIAALFADADAR